MVESRMVDKVLALRLRQQAAVAELGQRALAVENLDEFLAEAAAVVAEHLQVEFVKILERLPGSRELLLRAGVGWGEGVVGTALLPGDLESQAGYALTSNGPVVVEDTATEQRFRIAPLLLEHGVRSGVSCPIRGPRKPFGVLGAHTTDRRTFTQEDVNFLRAVANILGLAIQSHRTAAEQALLTEASDVLFESLDFERTLRNFAQLLTRRLSDWCAIHLVDDDGAIREIEIAHRDPERVALVRRWRDSYVLPASEGMGVRHIIESGRPEVYSHITDEMMDRAAATDGVRNLIQQVELRSALILPMVARGRTLGVVQLASTSPQRRFGYDDVVFGMELAQRAALAIDNARLYRAAQETADVREAFLVSVSHELRSPLTSVLGFANRLQRRSAQFDETTRGDIDTIASEAHRMKAALETLMNLADVESGRFEVSFEPVELRRLLAGEAASLRRRHPDAKIEERYPEDECVVETDADRVRHVIVDLLDNAVKHGGTPARITLELQLDDAHARISVRDMGPGVPEEMRVRIFERFFRGTSTSRGMGLGLYIAKLIANGLRAKLEVADADGGGAEFSLVLPRADITSSAAAPREAGAPRRQ